ncbi:MAG: bifunctional [glutamate--ammonia ligase]-adenylyl-L-tyrosine phosphorylase/[glutamate--ammonia-ligase] adenylyltransferase [Haliea sp.]|nr:bifunctional [glutamate--ammonia ligase]-adenylyl-L-tyrosine phosphorylase/[glutamate--ammonia-ligase] adenylyltransferase [Haliea sp.]
MIDAHALTPNLAAAASNAWQHILDNPDAAAVTALTTALAAQPTLAASLARVLACSPFVAGAVRRQPALLTELVMAGLLERKLAPEEMLTELRQWLAEPGAELNRVLRRFRQRHMLRIVWRDFCRNADTLETVADTSSLAEACIALAQEQLGQQLQARFGTPRGQRGGKPQQLIVIAMGKLGARELNVSSDIDLIFVFPEAGETDGERRSISNAEYFTKLGQGVINALDQVTADGFVFRVDMRLRPYGESGSLAVNFASLEEYYQEQGRDWERYALIKARPITGDTQRGIELMAMLRPFVFRRYVDFGVIESLRGMKQMINSEVRRRGLQDDVKLGHGGIREVEFIAQCFQLIRGGRDWVLQQRELLQILSECVALGCLPAEAVAELRAAYLFLRDSEHAIQGYLDQQTQALPTEPLQQEAMATVMGYAAWPDYLAALAAHRSRVASHFRDLIAEPDRDEAAADELPAWGDELTERVLTDLGYRAAASLEALSALHDSSRVATLQAEGRERLQQFMPRLLLACTEAADPDRALQRILPLVNAVLRRSAYLALLLENPPALADLVLLCDASPWIAEQLQRHPVLLDELLDRASLYTAPDKARLADELRQQVARLQPGDLEAQMDALRYFKAAHILRVAASEVVGRLPLMQVSDKLTWIAEVILEQVLAVAWSDLTARFGAPARNSAGSGFAVFGYGKLGGIELSYSSDLDLVFIFDADSQAVTDGERSTDNIRFYTRLGQRVIHILETRMAMGQLYEVDMRLRPSGASGLLATSLKGFRSYQEKSAWTWEHQALVRARHVAGDPAVAVEFDAVREAILTRARDADALAAEVVAMRARMRKELLPSQLPEGQDFDLKQSPGGIVDIEFMVQYGVLAWSHRIPELVRWSDNIRILETLAVAGLLSDSESVALVEAYLAFRSAAHQLALQQLAGRVDAAGYAQQRASVEAVWQRLFPAPLELTQQQD